MSYGWTPQTYLSLGSSATTVQGVGIRIHSVDAFNTSTAQNSFVRFYNATAATGGTTTANFLMVVGANSPRDIEWSGGMSFDTALVVDAAATATGASGTTGSVHLSIGVG